MNAGIFPSIKSIPVEQLIPYARNARTHSDEQIAQIAASIREFDKPQRNGEHPTMKPVALFEYQMLNNTKGQDIILDLFGGSGTTMIAAEKNGREARLMELDPKYCDVIIRRWQNFTGKKAIHAATGKTFDEVASHGNTAIPAVA